MWRDTERDAVVTCIGHHLVNVLDQMGQRSSLGQFELMVLLAVMRIGDHAYGVPIARAIEHITGRNVARGSVNFALDRLEAKGLVSSTLGEPTAARGGRAKRYFHATARGVREVHDTRRTLTRLWEGLPQLEGLGT